MRVLSTEDGNLEYSVTTGRSQKYIDIDLSFVPNASSNGDIFKKKEAMSVKQAVKNLLMTNHFEKPFVPFFGGNLNSLLFELSTNFDDGSLRDQIITQIDVFEPRAKVLDIQVLTEGDYDITVYVEFLVVNTSETVSFTTSLSRLR